MSLPSNTKTKINVLTDLATGGRDAQKTIRKVGGMVSGELSFNKLVRAAYPTTSRLFDYYKGEPDITDVLTWENSDEYSEVLLTETDRVNRLKAKL